MTEHDFKAASEEFENEFHNGECLKTKLHVVTIGAIRAALKLAIKYKPLFDEYYDYKTKYEELLIKTEKLEQILGCFADEHNWKDLTPKGASAQVIRGMEFLVTDPIRLAKEGLNIINPSQPSPKQAGA